MATQLAAVTADRWVGQQAVWMARRWAAEWVHRWVVRWAAWLGHRTVEPTVWSRAATMAWRRVDPSVVW